MEPARAVSHRSEGHRVLHWLRDTRCLFLMVSLVSLSAAYPFLHRTPLLLVFCNSMVLVAGVYSVAISRRRLNLAIAVTVAQIVAAITYEVTRYEWAFILSAVFIILAFALTISVVLRYVLRGRRATRDKLYGAVAVYFLIGFAWAGIYALVLHWDPGAIDGARREDIVYFSLITLATIGYGDIRPVSDLARSLAMLEGIVGVFYVATLVARLVAAYGGGAGADGSDKVR